MSKEKKMSIIKMNLTKAIEGVANNSPQTLEFISRFEGENTKSLGNRWELWLQVELLRELEKLTQRPNDLISEYRAPYKANKKKGAGRTAKGYVSGCLDIALRPKGGDAGLYAGVELKVKRNASSAIRGGLHDLLKVGAFTTDAWKFRAMYVLCVFDASRAASSRSKYLQFLEDQDWPVVDLGSCFKVAIIGWESSPRS
ncbi:hypothetical protein ABEP66_12065, partial [Cutibacterium acnes]